MFTNVCLFLFVSGYVRILSTFLAFYYVFTDPIPSFSFYLLGQGLDAIDGMTARAFNQCSKFGGLLDMLTDRMSTAVLLIVLSHLYSAYWGLFAFLIVLDIVSHWFQMYVKATQNKNTHKGSKNFLLNFYYTFPYALLVFCVGNEFCFVSLYLLAFSSSFSLYWLQLLRLVLYVSFPICAGKQFLNFVQLYDSCQEITEMDYSLHQQHK